MTIATVRATLIDIQAEVPTRSKSVGYHTSPVGKQLYLASQLKEHNEKEHAGNTKAYTASYYTVNVSFRNAHEEFM